MSLKMDNSRLLVFHEGRKRRIFVGELSYDQKKHRYEFVYDSKYSSSKRAIPVGPELDLFKRKFVSSKDELFPSFQDRIPSKANPAYEDYCKAQGISPSEENPMILLSTIGKRGPSSFIFESIYKNEFSKRDLIEFRKKIGLSLNDVAQAFDFNWLTLQRIESGKSEDSNSLKRLQIYLEFPEVALRQLKMTGSRVHISVLNRLLDYFEKLKLKRL